MRRFKVREVSACELEQLALIGVRALVENNKSVRRFAPLFMRKSYDRHFLYSRVFQKDAFDFDRRNVFAATDDDILYAVANFDVTIGMHDGGVAGFRLGERDVGARQRRCTRRGCHG